MPEKTLQEFKINTKRIVAIMFLFLISALVVGLIVVQKQAKQYATDQSTKAVLKIQAENRTADRLDAKIQRWNTNHTACGLRQLIDIKTLNKSLERAQAASKDKTTSESQRQRAKGSIKGIETQIKNAHKVIAIFGTIPPGFKCDTLSKKPPTE